jgi:hypothetical protein
MTHCIQQLHALPLAGHLRLSHSDLQHRRAQLPARQRRHGKVLHLLLVSKASNSTSWESTGRERLTATGGSRPWHHWSPSRITIARLPPFCTTNGSLGVEFDGRPRRRRRNRSAGRVGVLGMTGREPPWPQSPVRSPARGLIKFSKSYTKPPKTGSNIFKKPLNG